MSLERAEAYHLACPFTGAAFLVQFWDTHQENRHGKRRMCVAIFQSSPAFPSCYRLLTKTRHFWPALTISCDGPEAARHAIGFLDFEDILSDELEVSSPDAIGEHSLALR